MTNSYWYPFKISKKMLVWLFIPSLLWIGLAKIVRPELTHFTCTVEFQKCTPQNVNALERFAIENRSRWSMNMSDRLQNGSGLAAALTPVMMGFALANPPLAVARIFFTQVLVVAQVAVWNGLIMDTVRLIVQRPRPHVYRNGGPSPKDVHLYTSFYSGHTSFTAAMATLIFLTLLPLLKTKAMLLFFGASFSVIPIWTAYLRVVSGNHFPSDVAVGGVMGILVALFVYRFHRRNS